MQYQPCSMCFVSNGSEPFLVAFFIEKVSSCFRTDVTFHEGSIPFSEWLLVLLCVFFSGPYRVNCDTNFQAFSLVWRRHSWAWLSMLVKAVRQTPSSLS